MSGARVGVIGATGLVGSMICSILAERKLPISELRLFASSRSAGTKIDWCGQDVIVEDVEGASFKGLDIVLLSAGGGPSKTYAPIVVSDGAIAIDNSSAWRMDPDVPLVVSEVNPHALSSIPKGIVANPNCTTMIAMPVLKPLHETAGLKRFVVSTYQAVSGAGAKGVRELDSQLEKLSGVSDSLTSGQFTDFPVPEAFPETIAHNVLAQIGTLVDDETDEEKKFRNESRKILEISDLDVTCTCVRVPVFTGHSVSIDAEFSEDISVAKVNEVLANAPGVKLEGIPTPLKAAGGDVSLVGRVRQSGDSSKRIALFISGDNLRKGAALNAVQIAELLTR